MFLAHFNLPSIFTQIISRVSDNIPVEEVQQVWLSLCFLWRNEVSSPLCLAWELSVLFVKSPLKNLLSLFGFWFVWLSVYLILTQCFFPFYPILLNNRIDIRNKFLDQTVKEKYKFFLNDQVLLFWNKWKVKKSEKERKEEGREGRKKGKWLYQAAPEFYSYFHQKTDSQYTLQVTSDSRRMEGEEFFGFHHRLAPYSL